MAQPHANFARGFRSRITAPLFEELASFFLPSLPSSLLFPIFFFFATAINHENEKNPKILSSPDPGKRDL